MAAALRHGTTRASPRSLGKKSLNLRAIIITDSVHVELIIVDDTADGMYVEREFAPRGQKIVLRFVEHNLYAEVYIQHER